VPVLVLAVKSDLAVLVRRLHQHRHLHNAQLARSCILCVRGLCVLGRKMNCVCVKNGSDYYRA
jgi:hypothetical protein